MNYLTLTFQQTYITSGSAEYPPEYVAKCSAIARETTRAGTKLFRKALERDGTLAWLEGLPVAKKIGGWGFFHGGPPCGFPGGIDQLNEAFTKRLQAGEWDHRLLALYAGPESPVSTRGWMNQGEDAVDQLLSGFGVAQVAFGHSPGAINGVFGRLAQRWGKAFKADSYFSLGVAGCLEILDDSVWAVYTPESRRVYSQLHPQRPPLPGLELLWRLSSD